MSVLSISDGLTVWCGDGSFVWKEDGTVFTHSADDPAGAAELIAAHYRGLAAADPEADTGPAIEVAHLPPTDTPRERTA